MDETKFTDAFMAEQRELARKATERPWVNMTDETFWGQIRTASEDHFTHIAQMPDLDDRTDDFEYLTAAANHYPAALEEIERLRARAVRAERMSKTLDTIYAYFTREAAEPNSGIPTEKLIELMTEIEAVTGKEEYWP
jgi:hypothetical protein